MLKRHLVLALGIIAWRRSVGRCRGREVSANGTSLNGLTSNVATLHAIRLALPDGMGAQVPLRRPEGRLSACWVLSAAPARY
jgi:hypothetical protein